MLKKRVLTAIWIIPLLIAAVWFNRPVPWFTIFVAIWGVLAVFEFYRMVGVTRATSLTSFGLGWTLLLILSPHFDYDAMALLTLGIVFSLILLIFQPEKEGAFTHWVWTMAGILYVGWLLSHLVALRLDAGRGWVFFTIFITFGTDTAAFFVGRAIGRHRLAPQISPAKTWEGAIAGVLGAIIVSLLFTLPTRLNLPLSYVPAIFLGLVVSVFAQLGGLVMSLLKRNMGVKDSGTLIPGHGGLLDRTDSVVFAAIVVYYYLMITAV